MKHVPSLFRRAIECAGLQGANIEEYLPAEFGPIMVDRRWLTSTVTDMALMMRQEGPFDRLPILADALMDAGCDNEEIIGNCRQQEKHVRSCWVVDLLLA